MKVAIHQPQYLPWLPYLLKIEEADIFILLDTVGFQKNGLQNRNQVKTAQGAHWLTVPVRHQFGQKISDVKIENRTNWRHKHWQTLKQSYTKASSFDRYAEEIELFFTQEWINLNELNMKFLSKLMIWMDIRTPILRSSEMNSTGIASELVLNLCLEVGATRFLSGTGAKNYLESDEFERAGVEIVYRPPILPRKYPQIFTKVGFLNHLSVVDLLMNCGETWRNYLPAETNTP